MTLITPVAFGDVALDRYVQGLTGQPSLSIPSRGHLTEYILKNKEIQNKRNRLSSVQVELNWEIPGSTAKRRQEANEILSRLHQPKNFENLIKKKFGLKDLNQITILESNVAKFQDRIASLSQKDPNYGKDLSVLSAYLDTTYQSLQHLTGFSRAQEAEYLEQKKKVDRIAKLKKQIGLLPTLGRKEKERTQRVREDIKVLEEQLKTFELQSELPHGHQKKLVTEQRQLVKELADLEFERDQLRDSLHGSEYELEDAIRKEYCRLSKEFREAALTHCSPEEGGGVGHPNTSGLGCVYPNSGTEAELRQKARDFKVALSHVESIDPVLAARLKGMQKRLEQRAQGQVLPGSPSSDIDPESDDNEEKDYDDGEDTHLVASKESKALPQETQKKIASLLTKKMSAMTNDQSSAKDDVERADLIAATSEYLSDQQVLKFEWSTLKAFNKALKKESAEAARKVFVESFQSKLDRLNAAMGVLPEQASAEKLNRKSLIEQIAFEPIGVIERLTTEPFVQKLKKDIFGIYANYVSSEEPVACHSVDAIKLLYGRSKKITPEGKGLLIDFITLHAQEDDVRDLLKSYTDKNIEANLKLKRLLSLSSVKTI